MGDLTMCSPASGSAAGLPAAAAAVPRRGAGGRLLQLGAADKPGQIGDAGSGRCSLRKFQPDLHVAAIEIELGDLVLLQELDQFLQILHVLWFHSFLLLSRVGERQIGQSSISALGAGVST